MVVYSGERRLKDLIQFVNTEMEKAKRDRVQVDDHECSISVCVRACVCAFFGKVSFSFCLQEDKDRRKHIKAMKDEAKKADKSKDEL